MSIAINSLVQRAIEVLAGDPEEVRYTIDRLTPLVPLAVETWVEQNRNNREKMRNLTAQTNTSIINGKTITGQAKDALSNAFIRPDWITNDDVSIIAAAPNDSLVYDVVLVNSRARLRNPGIQDAFFTLCHFDGYTMFFRDQHAASGADPLTSLQGNVYIQGVCSNPDLSQMPATYEGEIAYTLAKIAQTTATDRPTKRRSDLVNAREMRKY